MGDKYYPITGHKRLKDAETILGIQALIDKSNNEDGSKQDSVRNLLCNMFWISVSEGIDINALFSEARELFQDEQSFWTGGE